MKKVKKNTKNTTGENKLFSIEALGTVNLLLEGVCLRAKTAKEARIRMKGIIERAVATALKDLCHYVDLEYKAGRDIVADVGTSRKPRFRTKVFGPPHDLDTALDGWMLDRVKKYGIRVPPVTLPLECPAGSWHLAVCKREGQQKGASKGHKSLDAVWEEQLERATRLWGSPTKGSPQNIKNAFDGPVNQWVELTAEQGGAQ